MDNDNIFKKLKELEVPVDEKGWQAIAHDKRVVRKFSRGRHIAKIAASATVASLVVGTIIFVAFSHINNSQSSSTAQSKTEVVSTQQQSSTELLNPDKQQGQNTLTQNFPKEPSFPKSDIQQSESQIIAKTTEKSNLPEITSLDPDNEYVIDTQTSKPYTTQTTLNTISKPKISQPNVELQNIQINNNNSEEDIQQLSDIKSDYSDNENYAEEEYKFFIPSAFTPNGDGLNDMFYVKANFEPKFYDLTIMNRGGDVVFRAKNINIGWDGKSGGKLLPQGMYIYIINYKDKDNKEQKLQGQVLLLP